jgi:hypothetical protein
MGIRETAGVNPYERRYRTIFWGEFCGTPKIPGTGHAVPIPGKTGNRETKTKKGITCSS